MIRNTNWDNLPTTVNALKEKMQNQAKGKNSFQKANVDDQNFKNVIAGFSVSCLETTGLAKQVYEQFKFLKSDFDKKVINAARYKEGLKPLHELLVGMSEKVNIKELNTPEIATELKRAGY